MIITHLKDGLGNQLFQYAVGRALAHKNNTELKLDITQNEAEKSSHHGFYRLGAFNIQENFATAEELKNPNLQRINDVYPVTAGFFIPQILDAPDNVYLKGFWQNEKYFLEIKDILLREFTLKNTLGEVSNSWREKILAADCSVSINVRRGDYLTPNFRYLSGLVPVSYYGECLSRLKENYPNLTAFVFSDDLNWCRENLNFGVPSEFVEGCEHAYEEMYLMSLCKHNIIANGTFSWWSAWLNQNPDKKVFAPHPWFNYLKDACTPVPDSWTKIPVDYLKHLHDEFPVLLSAIVYVDDGAKNLGLTLSGIFSQIFADYDVIIVDASTDGSANFYRQFAGNDNVTIIKAEHSTGKFAAWNLGLECARSEFVLFLTARDFIFPRATNWIYIAWEYNFNLHFNNRETSISRSNYLDLGPEIICTTQRLEESAAGQIDIGGIADKKFSALVDTAFQNLNAATEIKLDAAQKLMLLATNQLNNLIGTKFFKLKFLRENKIRFDEKIGASAKLMFLVDCFMRTENVILVPQIFYGRLGRD